jgi:hypothetical protein
MHAEWGVYVEEGRRGGCAQVAAAAPYLPHPPALAHKIDFLGRVGTETLSPLPSWPRCRPTQAITDIPTSSFPPNPPIRTVSHPIILSYSYLLAVAYFCVR